MTELERGRRRAGVVTSFDEGVGLGIIRSSTGDIHLFHCIEIADGSRSIAVGAGVEFDLLVKFGRYEAANVG